MVDLNEGRNRMVAQEFITHIGCNDHTCTQGKFYLLAKREALLSTLRALKYDSASPGVR